MFAAEDHNFFRHPGVDPIAIVRALITDLRAGAPRQGGSTLTQQLVKNTFLSPRRTLVRKVQEAVLAVLLELHATKDEILRRYLASVYLGTDGDVPIHGFAEGAQVYFGKPLPELGPEGKFWVGVGSGPDCSAHKGNGWMHVAIGGGRVGTSSLT